MPTTRITPTAVHVAVYDGLADFEPGHLLARINSPRWQRTPGRLRVVTVAETDAPITTMGGLRILPDVRIDDVDPERSAMLVLAGADTWDEGGNGRFAKLARRFLEAGVPVAAICGGTLGLAREGLLDDREHTSAAPQYLAAGGYRGAERYRQAPAVTDGDLITAGPAHGLEFAVHALARLDVFEPEVLEAYRGLFTDGDPRWFGALAAAEAAPAAA